jgi:hypothetical protein
MMAHSAVQCGEESMQARVIAVVPLADDEIQVFEDHQRR